MEFIPTYNDIATHIETVFNVELHPLDEPERRFYAVADGDETAGFCHITPHHAPRAVCVHLSIPIHDLMIADSMTRLFEHNVIFYAGFQDELLAWPLSRTGVIDAEIHNGHILIPLADMEPIPAAEVEHGL